MWTKTIQSSSKLFTATASKRSISLGCWKHHGTIGNIIVVSSSCPGNCRHVHVERHLKELGITLPPAPTPRANYNIACHASGNIIYISGHLPLTAEGTLCTGHVGPATNSAEATTTTSEQTHRSLEYGYQAARHTGLNIIATIQSQLEGDLDRVEQIVKLFGIVNSTDDFKHQHLVMDGCSDVIMEVFGPKVGYHARSAIGTTTLPLDATIEVEAIVQIKPKA